MSEYRPFSQETHPEYNQEPGLVLIPGSFTVREHSKWEQFPSKYTVGTSPGNPYTYRPFPKMLYRADRYNGQIVCMGAPPDPSEFKDPREAERAEEHARRFTEKCQLIVRDEAELSRAMESGWRETPQEAVEHVLARDRVVAQETAERQYQDRNMSERARREADLVVAESGGEHQPEITGRKSAEAKESRRRRSA